MVLKYIAKNHDRCFVLSLWHNTQRMSSPEVMHDERTSLIAGCFSYLCSVQQCYICAKVTCSQKWTCITETRKVSLPKKHQHRTPVLQACCREDNLDFVTASYLLSRAQLREVVFMENDLRDLLSVSTSSRS